MKSPKPNRKHRKRFMLSCFISIFLLCILASINEVRFENLLRFGRCTFSNNTTNTSSSISNEQQQQQDIRILIGILTLPDQYLRRHFLRLVYGTQNPEGAKIDVKFVFCNLTKEDQKTIIALEIMLYNDIVILNCTENMNKGKTSTFFTSLPEIFNETVNGPNYPPYHYVMKADDDTYVRLNSLVKSLKPLPKEDLYYGFVIPCTSMDPFKHYMSGMGFLVSWDIVEWIHGSDIPKKHVEGPEDKVFGDWMRWGRRGLNRFNAKWSMYNYPDPVSVCSHELVNDTIAVHLLKNQEEWIKTLNFFNHTGPLKESKMYHIA